MSEAIKDNIVIYGFTKALDEINDKLSKINELIFFKLDIIKDYAIKNNPSDDKFIFKFKETYLNDNTKPIFDVYFGLSHLLINNKDIVNKIIDFKNITQNYQFDKGNLYIKSDSSYYLDNIFFDNNEDKLTIRDSNNKNESIFYLNPKKWILIDILTNNIQDSNIINKEDLGEKIKNFYKNCADYCRFLDYKVEEIYTKNINK